MQKKFRSNAAAAKYAKVIGYKIKRGKATKLADGTKANWYTLTKLKSLRSMGYPYKKKAKKRR